KLEWRADEVQAVIGSAQEVLGSPGWGLDADVGFFGRLTLVPSALKAARDPDGRTLREVLPPDLYARWAQLKQRHIGRDGGIEKDRPLVAATQLYAAALKDVGLGRSSPVSKVVEKAAKAHGLKPVLTRVEIKIADPRQALKEVRGTALQDLECFRRTLDVVEHGLPLLAERANAWSVGDVEALQRLAVEGQYAACVDAVANSAFGRRRGLSDVDAQAQRKWLGIASDALGRNAVTFATVPVSSLVSPGGYLEQLRARGFEVKAPE
ncbi:MAG: TraB/GumN family protein, partial [Pseudoxanthomonas sp.]